MDSRFVKFFACWLLFLAVSVFGADTLESLRAENERLKAEIEDLKTIVKNHEQERAEIQKLTNEAMAAYYSLQQICIANGTIIPPGEGRTPTPLDADGSNALVSVTPDSQFVKLKNKIYQVEESQRPPGKNSKTSPAPSAWKPGTPIDVRGTGQEGHVLLIYSKFSTKGVLEQFRQVSADEYTPGAKK